MPFVNRFFLVVFESFTMNSFFKEIGMSPNLSNKVVGICQQQDITDVDSLLSLSVTDLYQCGFSVGIVQKIKAHLKCSKSQNAIPKSKASLNSLTEQRSKALDLLAMQSRRSRGSGRGRENIEQKKKVFGSTRDYGKRRSKTKKKNLGKKKKNLSTLLMIM